MNVQTIRFDVIIKTEMLPTEQGTIDVEMQAKYKNYKDDRPSSQKAITLRLSRALTQVNLLRLADPINYTPASRKAREQFIYVYCSGTPPFQRQAQNMPFYNNCITIRYTPLQQGLPEEETKRQPTTWRQWADILNNKINQISTTRPVVLSFHSFGTYIATQYLHFYGSKRVVGFIDLGGLPLRFTKQIRDILKATEMLSLQDLEQNIDIIYQVYRNELTEKVKRGDKTVNNNILENKYQLLGAMKAYKDKHGAVWTFDRFQEWPGILKCFIYGRDDVLLSEELLSQKVAFYSYKKKLNPSYEQLACEAFLKLRGRKVDNVQERFIYSIEGGPHIVHMKKKNKQLIGSIIEQYLTIIEEIHYQQSQPSSL